MSDHKVPEQAFIYIECPDDCGWKGPVMADVSTTHARKSRMACPRCGQVFDVRAELDVKVTAVNTGNGAAASRRTPKTAERSAV